MNTWAVHSFTLNDEPVPLTLTGWMNLMFNGTCQAYFIGGILLDFCADSEGRSGSVQ
jgi:hypothetical protein